MKPEINGKSAGDSKFGKNNNFSTAKNLPVKVIKMTIMKKSVFKLLAQINKKVLPSYSKKRLDLAKASKAQMAIIGWKLWVTKRALD